MTPPIGGEDAARSRHSDDDLAAHVPPFQIAQARSRVRQRVAAVDDGCERYGLDELDDGEQVLPLPGARRRTEPLPDQSVDRGHAEEPPDQAEQAAAGRAA